MSFPGNKDEELKTKIAHSTSTLDWVLDELEERATVEGIRQKVFVPEALDMFYAEQMKKETSKKRKASDTGRKRSPTTTANITLPATTTDDSAQPPAKKPRKGALEEPRRPEAEDAFYSDDFYRDATRWHQSKDRNRKLKYSHIGRIHETDAGKVADKPCSSCEESRHECKVYTEGSLGKYFYAMGTNKWRSCGRCRLSEFGRCSFIYDAEPTPKEKKERAKSRVYAQYMGAGLRCPPQHIIDEEVAIMLEAESGAETVRTNSISTD